MLAFHKPKLQITTNLLTPSRLQSYHHEVTVVLELIVLLNKLAKRDRASDAGRVIWSWVADFEIFFRPFPLRVPLTSNVARRWSLRHWHYLMNQRCVALHRSTTSPTIVPATPAGIPTGLQTSHRATSQPKRGPHPLGLVLKHFL